MYLTGKIINCTVCNQPGNHSWVEFRGHGFANQQTGKTFPVCSDHRHEVYTTLVKPALDKAPASTKWRTVPNDCITYK